MAFLADEAKDLVALRELFQTPLILLQLTEPVAVSSEFF